MDDAPPKSIDSSVYKRTFFGILNKDGDFWTPLAFDAPDKARQHIRDFWLDKEKAEECLRTFKIVPVRIQLTVSPPSPLSTQSEERS